MSLQALPVYPTKILIYCLQDWYQNCVGKIQIGISVIAMADGPISTYQALWTAISAHY